MRNDENKDQENLVDEKSSELATTGIPGSYFVTVRLNDGLSYNNYTATIKGADKELEYDKYVDGFFYEDYKDSSKTVTVVITEKLTGKTQEVILNLK